VKAGKLAVVGVVQEQHPDRARLYRQWRGFDWPILVDSLNLLGLKAVPKAIAIDESGIVRVAAARPALFARQFLDREFERVTVPRGLNRAKKPFPHEKFLYGGEDGIEAFEKGATDGPGWFRLGVALKRRSESGRAKPDDEQRAIAAWGKALSLDPNQYIWRRRIQQYGPVLAKPYGFYSWVDRARVEIRQRGKEPRPLAVEPAGSEIQEREGPPGRNPEFIDPDPEGKIARDTDFVTLRTLVTPARVRPRHPFPIRVKLMPAKAEWNDEGGETILSLARGSLGRVLGKYTRHTGIAGRRPRLLFLDFEVPAHHEPGETELRGYVLYGICEDGTGVCRFLRQDFTAVVTVDPEAPSIR
jgi:hypothetical protein